MVECSIVNNNVNKEVHKVVNSLVKAPLVWGRYYLSKHFRMPSPSFHSILMNSAVKHDHLAVAAPRGSSKTTILGFNYPFHCICYKKKHFIVYISNTFKQSTLLLHSIKQEVKENEKLKQDFPLEIVKDAEDVTVFRHHDGFETMVICLGADQMGNIRGRKFGAYRPDLIVLDDVENDELVRSADRRLKLQEDFDNAVTPSGDIGTQFIAVGTILHDDSLIRKLLDKDKYTEYTKLFFCGLYETKEGLTSLWKEKMPVEDLLRYKKDKPYTFAKEIQNDPSSGGTEDIDKKDFRYWRIENNQYILFDDEGNIKSKGDLRDCKPAIACDLAWEIKEESDFSVIMPGFLTPTSDILIDDYIHKKGMRPNELEEILFSMEERMRLLTGSAVPIGFEKAKLEKVAKWSLKEAMKRRNHFLMFKDLEWGSDKLERILSKLQPRYVQHMIYHKRGMGELETELTRLRSSAHDDLADSAQGLVQLLQFPKKTHKKVFVEDPMFDWLKKNKLGKQIKKKTPYVYGKSKVMSIPHKTTWR